MPFRKRYIEHIENCLVDEGALWLDPILKEVCISKFQFVILQQPDHTIDILIFLMGVSQFNYASRNDYTAVN